jgi:hypothetical protein
LSVPGRIVSAMLNWFRRILLGEDATRRELAALRAAEAAHYGDLGHRFDQTSAHLHRLESLIMANQDQINAFGDRLEAATTGIRSDIEDLKRQIADGTPAEQLDFTALESRVAGLEGLDAENPAPPADPTV